MHVGAPTRQQIADEARSYLGVPWKHMGRSRKGVDCVGLVICIAKTFNLCPPDLKIPPYGRHPDGTLMRYFSEHMDRATVTDLRLGSVAVFSYMGSPYHAGVVINAQARAIVHAFAAARKVVPDNLDNGQHGRRLVAVWDYRGVKDG